LGFEGEMMRISKMVAVASGVFFLAAGQGLAAGHTLDKNCDNCHVLDTSENAPKVTPPEPGFFQRLFFGKKSYKGHPTVSCSGVANANGSVTGCHDVGKGYSKLLVVDLKGKPSDELCGRCHADQRVFGSHHPSYRVDKNGDGVGDRLVVPVTGQEALTVYAPSSQAEPLKSYPDSLVIVKDEKDATVLRAAIPLAQIVEQVSATEKRTVDNVVTCTSCHNPHFGYLAATGVPETLKPDIVARPEGDALLRMQDHDNTLCVACH
jgi:hypothetical protein